MPSLLPPRDDWPFPPGEGPFRIKGTAYRGHMEFVAAHVPGGVAAMLAGLPDDRYRTFFEAGFLASTFYDIYPLMMAAEPCGALMDMGPEEFVAQRSRDQAPKDLGGVYRFVLAMVPTGSVARRLPRLLTQVCDFAAPTVTLDKPGHVEAFIDGVPAAIGPWLSAVLMAYGEEALRVSGAKSASFVARPSETETVQDGVRFARIHTDIRYG